MDCFRRRDALSATPGVPTERQKSAAFRSILVPVDGSEISEQAITYASQFDVDRIVLLRVEPREAPEEQAAATDAYAHWQREQLEKVTQHLDELRTAHARAAGTVETLLRYGNPAEEIITEAENHDLVVMSSHGKGAAGRLVFGSVADRVVRYGSTPTLLVRAGEHGVATMRPTRVVVPLDGSEIAENALPVVTRLSSMFGVPAHLVRIIDMEEVLRTVRQQRAPASEPEPYERARVATESAAIAYLEAVQTKLKAQGVETTIGVTGGTPSFELIWMVAEEDLVVMTSRGLGGFQRWMVGSVAEKMVREAKAPVLLVPVQSASESAG